MMPVLIGLLYVNEFRSLSDLYDSHIFHFSSSSFKHLVAFFSFSLSLSVFNLPEKKCVHGQIQSTHTNIAVKQSTKARNVLSFFAIVFIFRTTTLANRCNTELQIDGLFVLISFFVFGNVYIWYASWRHCQFQWNHTFFSDSHFFSCGFFHCFSRENYLYFVLISRVIFFLFHAHIFDEILFYWFHWIWLSLALKHNDKN